MEPDSLKREWEELAAAWIRDVRGGADLNRAGLLDRPMLEACGEVAGLRVLDCGCGEGRFCRMLVERGAEYVLGLDLCAPMIQAAKELQSGRDEYRIADVQDLGFLDDGVFDLAVSYLNQCDLPDFKASNREVARVLRAGGRFVVANIHPMRSAVGGWRRTASGEKEHVILDRYFDESERRWTMKGMEFTNFHRSLATYVNDFLEAGFELAGLVEPTVTEEQAVEWPDLEDEMRVPNFIVYILKKKANT